MSNAIVQYAAPGRSGWWGHPRLFARLDDSINPLSTDRIGWYVEGEDGERCDMYSSWGFTACAGIYTGKKYRSVCVYQRVGQAQPTTYTGEWVEPEVFNATPFIDHAREPIVVTEPGTVVYLPKIQSDDKYCITVKAPGVTILGGEIGGHGGILLTEKAKGTMIYGVSCAKTIHYGLGWHATREQEFTCIRRSYFGPSEKECSIRNTATARNLVMVESHAKDNRSKQAFRMAGQGGRYFNIHNSKLENGGLGIGNFGAHWASHFRMDRCEVFGDNDRNQPDTPGGDSLVTIKANARDVTICSNKLTSDTTRRTLTLSTKADKIDRSKHPDAWNGGGGITFAHNDIKCLRNDPIRASEPEGWDESPITIENNTINGQPDNATGKPTPGVWTDFEGRELPPNARAGSTQRIPLQKPGKHARKQA